MHTHAFHKVAEPKEFAMKAILALTLSLLLFGASFATAGITSVRADLTPHELVELERQENRSR